METFRIEVSEESGGSNRYYKFILIRLSDNLTQTFIIDKVSTPFGNCQLGTVPYFIQRLYNIRDLFRNQYELNLLIPTLILLRHIYYPRVLVNVIKSKYDNFGLEKTWFKKIIKRKSRPYYNRPGVEMIDLDLDLSRLTNLRIKGHKLYVSEISTSSKSTPGKIVYELEFSIGKK
jgi:hypothetical protein